MAVELHQVRRNMQAMVRTLSADPDIQADVQQLAYAGREIASAYNFVMENEGHQLLIQKAILISCEHPRDVDVVKMESAAEAVITQLKDIQQRVIEMQTGIHVDIESCRGRKAKHESEIKKKHIELDKLRKQISRNEEHCKSLDKDLADRGRSLANLETQSKENEKKFKKNKDTAIATGVAAGVGLILAPFTAGLSLAAAAATGAACAVTAVNAEDNRNAMNKAKQNMANQKREAENIKKQQQHLRRSKSKSETQIQKEQLRIDHLTAASTSLQEVTGMLLNVITLIDDRLHAFQEMDTYFKQAMLDTHSFTIIQNALGRSVCPEKLEGRAKERLDKLKITWEVVEDILMNQGVGVKTTPAFE